MERPVNKFFGSCGFLHVLISLQKPNILNGNIFKYTFCKKIDIHKYITVPICLQNHWCLAMVNFKEKKALWYDPMAIDRTKDFDHLIKFLKEEKEARLSEYDLTWLEKLDGQVLPRK